MPKLQTLQDNFEDGMSVDVPTHSSDSEPWYGHKFKEVVKGVWECECGITLYDEDTKFKNIDLTSLKEVVGAYRMYKSPNQQDALKTNERLQAYGEAVESMMDALGIDEEFLIGLVKKG